MHCFRGESHSTVKSCVKVCLFLVFLVSNNSVITALLFPVKRGSKVTTIKTVRVTSVDTSREKERESGYKRHSQTYQRSDGINTTGKEDSHTCSGCLPPVDNCSFKHTSEEQMLSDVSGFSRDNHQVLTNLRSSQLSACQPLQSSQHRIVIRGGRVVNDDCVTEADVYIEEGIIR